MTNTNTKNTGTPSVGEVYQGAVVKLLNFGAFVDFGFNQDGLVHISEITSSRIANIEEALKVGQEVTVKVIGFDEKGRIKLSIKQASDNFVPAPRPEFGQIYEGKVANIVEYGAFVNFGFERDGMVHISEIASHRINRVEDVLKKGDDVRVRFLGYDRGRIRLSIKQADEECSPPAVGEIYEGTIVRVMPFGAFVKFGFAQDGMVHVSEMIEDGGPRQDANDLVSVGEKVSVKFLGYDEMGRIRLSMIKAED